MNSDLFARALTRLSIAITLLSSLKASEPAFNPAVPGKRPDGQWLAAPGYTLASWQSVDGLPQMTPSVITQTRDGYIWVGTLNGLARFDGVRFTSFTVNNTPQLLSDHITQLFEDSSGMLWIGTSERGLIRYRAGKFDAVPLSGESAVQLAIHSICEDRKGVVWVGTSKGLCRLNVGRLEKHPLTDRPVVTILRGFGDDLWIGTHWDIQRLAEDRLTSAPITSARKVRYWAMDATGQLWASYMEGNLGVAAQAANSVKGSTPHARFKVDVFHRTRSQALWMGTLTGALYELAPEAADPFVLRANFKTGITAIHEDKNRNLWVGLEARGLWRLRKNPLLELGEEHGLPVQPVTSICQDGQGRIWCGTFGASLHLWNGSEFENIAAPGVPPQVSSLLWARDGKLWFSSYGGRLARRLEGGQFEYEETFGKHTRTLFQDRDGGIWCGKFLDGLFHRARDGRSRRYSEHDGLSNESIQAIAQDRSGDLWIGTAKGLNRLRIQNSRIDRFFREEGLAGENVRSLFVDSKGTLWIGCTGGGLTRWSGERLESIGVREGLINDGIEQILEDDHGYLWLGSNAGLMRVDLRQLDDCIERRTSEVHCMAFRREAGMPPSFGSGFQPSCFKASDGKLWFGTMAGIVVIDPAGIPSTNAPPPVYVEEVQGDKTTWLIAPGSDDVKVIPAGTRRLEFRYTGLDFEAPTLVRFRYKLEGFETEWVNAGNRREAVYARIPPGEYRFRVSAANNQGVWNESGAAMAFVVQPFFWQTRSFLVAAPVCSLIASGALAWGVVTRKHRRELEKIEAERALERERARIAQDMHDGLGASLVKISMLGERVERCLAEPDQAQTQIRKITATARHLMTEMDEIVWAVNPRNDTLENFAGYLCQFAREQFNDSDIACHVEVPGKLPTQSLAAEVRHNLLLAVREALNNSLKHSRGANVRIAMKYLHPRITIEIQDDGVGIISNGERQGNGLGNIRRRLERLGGEAHIQSASNGTHVRLSLNIEH